MTDPTAIARAEFDVLCRVRELAMAADEADRLYEAYLQLRVQLARIPAAADFAPEPAFALALGGARPVR